MFNVLSLGAGVQSTCVYLMSCIGEIERLDCAVFADTGWEPQAVYDHLGWLETQAEKYGTPIHRVGVGNIKEDALRLQVRGKKTDGKRFASMPLRVLGPQGEQGMIRRQCTREYKIEPIERFIKTELLGLKPRSRWPKERVVRHWFGISADEARRRSWPVTKKSYGISAGNDLFGSEQFEKVTQEIPIAWKSNVYPLCDCEWMNDKTSRDLGLHPMGREDCYRWFESHGFPRPPRSACIGCPFRSPGEWAMLKDRPAEWEDAVEFDKAIRNCGGMRGEMFLHRDYVPLGEAKINPDEDYPMFGCDDGVCGV